jgi:hypothetical protein
MVSGISDKLPDEMKNSKLFSQKAFKRALQKSEHPEFNVDSIFDFGYKEGKKIKVAKKEKQKGKEKLSLSFGNKMNPSYYKYNQY